jgi:hypothetical protein
MDRFGSRDQQVDRAVLRFTVKRGRRVAVGKTDYFWELSRMLQGMTYGELWRSLQRLREKGLVSIELLEKTDWMVKPTDEGIRSVESPPPSPRRTTMYEPAPPPASVTCPKCHAEMSRGARVCTQCGLSLAWTKL